jgi:hypothetical protein
MAPCIIMASFQDCEAGGSPGGTGKNKKMQVHLENHNGEFDISNGLRTLTSQTFAIFINTILSSSFSGSYLAKLLPTSQTGSVCGTGQAGGIYERVTIHLTFPFRIMDRFSIEKLGITIVSPVRRPSQYY